MSLVRSSPSLVVSSPPAIPTTWLACCNHIRLIIVCSERLALLGNNSISSPVSEGPPPQGTPSPPALLRAKVRDLVPHVDEPSPPRASPKPNHLRLGCPGGAPVRLELAEIRSGMQAYAEWRSAPTIVATYGAPLSRVLVLAEGTTGACCG